jgi:hypothetical protein
VRWKLFSLLQPHSHNDEETRNAINLRERELKEERALTTLARREAMDRLFNAMLTDPPREAK